MPRRTCNEDLAKPPYLTASDEGAATRHSRACARPVVCRRRRRNEMPAARLNRLAVPDLLPGLGSFQPLGQKVTNLGTDGPAVRIQRDAFHAGPV